MTSRSVTLRGMILRSVISRQVMGSFVGGPRRELLGLILLLVSASACTEGDDQPGAVELDTIVADQVLFGVSQNIGVEGVREAMLQADSLFMWEDSTHVHIEGLHLTIFDTEGRQRATIDAERGQLSAGSNELIAKGDVVLVVAEENREIRSQELRFAPETDRIWTDSAFTMAVDGCQVSGTRLAANMNFTEWQVWGTAQTCPAN